LRPDYESRIRQNIDIEDGRLSFFSGHASISFNMATYLSLYTFEHIGDFDNSLHVLGKISTITALTGLAFWTSYTRILDNKHHLGDVLTGAAIGTSIAFLVYSLQNEWFFSFYERNSTVEIFTLNSKGDLALLQIRF